MGSEGNDLWQEIRAAQDKLAERCAAQHHLQDVWVERTDGPPFWDCACGKIRNLVEQYGPAGQEQVTENQAPRRSPVLVGEHPISNGEGS